MGIWVMGRKYTLVLVDGRCTHSGRWCTSKRLTRLVWNENPGNGLVSTDPFS
jgi:outer membrane receptor for ferrienterochelin and colicin